MNLVSRISTCLSVIACFALSKPSQADIVTTVPIILIDVLQGNPDGMACGSEGSSLHIVGQDVAREILKDVRSGREPIEVVGFPSSETLNSMDDDIKAWLAVLQRAGGTVEIVSEDQLQSSGSGLQEVVGEVLADVKDIVFSTLDESLESVLIESFRGYDAQIKLVSGGGSSLNDDIVVGVSFKCTN
ncbi:hypothetical protein AAFO92_17230 [Roseovarius sp. CAU 1744]|uniref:hypothetical protein n=1 Tax=Roseovarius sp. CAU 1744 TaxID=3140368 RepID=UPI00325B5FFA